MVAWLYGCMVAWLHGFHGCIVARLHGCLVAWLHGCIAWLHGCVVAWLHGLHGCMVAWLHGCMVVWLHGYMVLLFIDLVVFVGMLGYQLSRTVGQKLVLLYNNISNRTHCRRNKVVVFKHLKTIYFIHFVHFNPDVFQFREQNRSDLLPVHFSYTRTHKYYYPKTDFVIFL
jgi:hypothetical protein